MYVGVLMQCNFYLLYLPGEQILQDWQACPWQQPSVEHHQRRVLRQWCPPETAATAPTLETVPPLPAVTNVSPHTSPVSAAPLVAPIVVSTSDPRTCIPKIINNY